MNKAHLELLRQRYEEAVHKYCKAFCEKHGYVYDPNSWVRNKVGEVVEVADLFIDFCDIRLDIDNDVPPEKFQQWYDYSLEIAMLDDGGGNMKQCNYEHWLMGARPYSKEDLEKIREAKKRVAEAEHELDRCIAQYRHDDARTALEDCLAAQTDVMNFTKK